MTKKVEHVELTVKLPKQVVAFIEKFTTLAGYNLNEFIEMAIRSELHAMINCEEIFDTPWSETEDIVKANNLKSFLDDC